MSYPVIQRMKDLGVSDDYLTEVEGKLDDVLECDDIDERMDMIEEILGDLGFDYPEIHDTVEDDIKDFTLY